MVHYSLGFTAYKAASGGVSLRCGTPKTLQKHAEVGEGPCKACRGRPRTLPSMPRSCEASLHILGSHNYYLMMAIKKIDDVIIIMKINENILINNNNNTR